MLKTKKAFTLAEVLITLGIIGVVAALTIPVLMKNYQNMQYATQAKKAYSELNQAFASLAREYNCVGDISCTSLFNGASTTPYWVTALDKLSANIKISQNCGTAGTGCFSSNYKDFNGPNNDPVTSGAKALTVSGYALKISDFFGNNCDPTYTVTGQGAICAEVDIDINGPKPPNQIGRDYFEFYLTNSGNLYPMGGHLQPTSLQQPWDINGGNSNTCLTTMTSYGHGCTGRLAEANWQMNY